MRQSSPEPKDVRGVRKGARAPSDRRKIGDGNARKGRSRYNRAGGYEGVYDAAMHGLPKCSKVFGHKTTARNVAAIIRQRDDYTLGTPGSLLSCETGKGEECFAQSLADELRVEVPAPNDILWSRNDYSFTIGASRYENTGKMETFKPRENK